MNQPQNQTLNQTRMFPPRQVFADNGYHIEKFLLQTNEQSVMTQSGLVIERVDLPSEGGILSYIKGFTYPKKGFPFQEVVVCTKNLKRVIMGTLRFLSSSPFKYFLIIFELLPNRLKMKIIHSALEQFA